MTSTREIPNQRISGVELTERDCFLWLINNLGEARDAANGLAQLRKDLRFYQIAMMLDRVKDNASRLMTKPKGLIIPGRM